MSNPTSKQSSAVVSTAGPSYATDERQPQSAIHELKVLSEREDGTFSDDPPQRELGDVSADTHPIIKLTADEHQPIDAGAERNALSEREDGTNIG